MSLIKLAYTPIIVVSKHDDANTGSSKSFSKRNIAATATGALTGFAAQEGIEHLPGFNKELISHRLGRRLGSVAGAFAGAAGLYGIIKKREKDHTPDVIIY